MFTMFPHFEYTPTDDDIEFIKAKLAEAIKLKKQYTSLIQKYNKNVDELNRLINEYNAQIKESEKKVNYFEDIQRLFRNKYGSEPYLDTFIQLYKELSDNKNITLQIVKNDKNNKYTLLVESGGLNECEQMKLKLLKDMFEHINKLIFN